MKRFYLFPLVPGLILITVILVSGCVGKPSVNSPVPAAASPDTAALLWNIVDHKDRETENDIPLWAAAWLNRDNSAVGGETVDIRTLEAEYRDRYIFVAANSGTNFNALSQWQEAFSPELDFARLIAVRIENRFLAALRTHPDNEYGSFFETIIRAASDAEWKGTVREDDFWVKREYPEADGVQTDRESWDFLVLVTVEKNTLDAQINTLLQNTKPEFPLTRDQTTAVNRIREHFFDGF